MFMLKEFIQKEHPCKELKPTESGECPVLPDFAHISIIFYDLASVLQKNSLSPEPICIHPHTLKKKVFYRNPPKGSGDLKKRRNA
jgi:hypothetical protein